MESFAPTEGVMNKSVQSVQCVCPKSGMQADFSEIEITDFDTNGLGRDPATSESTSSQAAGKWFENPQFKVSRDQLSAPSDSHTLQLAHLKNINVDFYLDNELALSGMFDIRSRKAGDNAADNMVDQPDFEDLRC
mmetsp:Transcript_52972/g.139586  ORF Transcript_52972/g.139586 Transcript_52972/m.139586 type:complete len:135 (-) Transcript_52972:41-445(-)